MIPLHRTGRFRKDFRREKRRDAEVVGLLRNVIDLLVEGQELPEFLKDHPPQGELGKLSGVPPQARPAADLPGRARRHHPRSPWLSQRALLRGIIRLTSQ